MVRTPLTERERARGLALGRALQAARGHRSAAEVARLAGISLDTLRKIERGAIATPAFFTVTALARVLDLDLAVLGKLSADDLPAPGIRRPGPLRPAAESSAKTPAEQREPDLSARSGRQTTGAGR